MYSQTKQTLFLELTNITSCSFKNLKLLLCCNGDVSESKCPQDTDTLAIGNPLVKIITKLSPDEIITWETAVTVGSFGQISFHLQVLVETEEPMNPLLYQESGKKERWSS